MKKAFLSLLFLVACESTSVSLDAKTTSGSPDACQPSPVLRDATAMGIEVKCVPAATYDSVCTGMINGRGVFSDPGPARMWYWVDDKKFVDRQLRVQLEEIALGQITWAVYHGKDASVEDVVQ